jgi:hypothetical protein
MSYVDHMMIVIRRSGGAGLERRARGGARRVP